MIQTAETQTAEQPVNIYAEESPGAESPETSVKSRRRPVRGDALSPTKQQVFIVHKKCVNKRRLSTGSSDIVIRRHVSNFVRTCDSSLKLSDPEV